MATKRSMFLRKVRRRVGIKEGENIRERNRLVWFLHILLEPIDFLKWKLSRGGSVWLDLNSNIVHAFDKTFTKEFIEDISENMDSIFWFDKDFSTGGIRTVPLGRLILAKGHIVRLHFTPEGFHMIVSRQTIKAGVVEILEEIPFVEEKLNG